MDISKINWGNDSAEKDPNLLDYFVTQNSYHRLMSTSKSFVVGRKGSGKSALRKKLYDDFSKKDDNVYVIQILPNYNTIRSILNEKDFEDYNNEIFFQYAWLRHIYLQALNLIGSSLNNKMLSGSFAFARHISEKNLCSNNDILETFRNYLTKVKIQAGKLGDLGVNIEKELIDIADITSYEFHLSEILKTGKKIIYMFDDLDLGWNNSELTNNILLGLLATLNHTKGVNENFHTFIFIRSDMYRILLSLTQHSDKYRDLEEIKWDTLSLKDMLELRIAYNLRYEINGSTSYFDYVFPQTISTSQTLNWLVERTLGRPRELLQLVRLYTENWSPGCDTSEILKEAESKYSDWKLSDLCSEFMSQYPNLKTVLDFWKTKFFRHKYHLKRAEIEEMAFTIFLELDLKEEWFVKLVDNCDLDNFLNILYEVGFIGDFILGGSGGSKTIYSHEDSHNPLFNEVQVHPCFRKAVNTVERIREKNS